MVVLRPVGWWSCRFFLGEYQEELVVFRWDLLMGLCLIRFFYLVDYCLADFPGIRLADFPFFQSLLVVLFYGFFFRDCICSW